MSGSKPKGEDFIPSVSAKVFTFEDKGSKWELPDRECCLSQHWQVEELQKNKILLNCVKSELNNKNLSQWSKHTKSMNVAVDIVPSVRKRVTGGHSTVTTPLCTIAWCKFYEILHHFPEIIPEFTLDSRGFHSLHLCEAPGAFIRSLEYHLQQHQRFGTDLHNKWRWLAVSYNPYYEGIDTSLMISDDGLIKESLGNWIFGKADTGDISDIDNLSDIISEVSQKLQPVSLVTADGSINCSSNPAEQEEMVSGLITAEIIAALSCLRLGGNFVLKLFTLFEATSICFIYLLNCLFEKVSICKPISSKPGNSEVYLVATNYKCPSEFMKVKPYLVKSVQQPEMKGLPLFSKDVIPFTFMEQHLKCSRLFTDLQVAIIQRNIRYFGNMDAVKRAELEELKSQCQEAYMKLCHLDEPTVNCHHQRKRARVGSAGSSDSHGQWKKYKPNIFKLAWRPVSFEDNLKWQMMGDVERFEYLSCRVPAAARTSGAGWCVGLSGPGAQWSGRAVEESRCRSGQPVDRVRNSTFCDIDLLEFYNELCDCYTPSHHHQHTVGLDTSEVVLRLVREKLGRLTGDAADDYDLPPFHLRNTADDADAFTFKLIAYPQRDTMTPEQDMRHLGHSDTIISQFVDSIQQIVDAKTTSEPTPSVYVIPIYGVFTRLYAGLLYYLLALFERAIVCRVKSQPAVPPFSCWLVLWKRVYEKDTDTMVKTMLHDLKAKREESQSGYRACLEIVPISALLQRGIFNCLSKVNNSILLSNIHEMTLS